DLHGRPVRAFGLTLEVEHAEIADPGAAERLGIRGCTSALQHQHRQPLVVREKVARKAAERKRTRRARHDQFRLTHIDQFNEYACELYNPVVCAPGMAMARADSEACAAIEFASRVEVADGVHDMVETVRHRKRP